MTATILCGDVRDMLRSLEAESVQCVVTSPPYFGLRDYGVDGQIGLESTPAEFICTMADVFREVRRVLRPDGVVFVNIGDSYFGTGKGPTPPTGFHGANGTPYPTRGVYTHQTLKPKDLMLMPARVALALQDDGWWIRSEIIWCLSGGVRVYAKTQKGEMPMTIKDMVRLDPSTVQLWNGEKWTQVLGWSQSETRDGALEIELRSGQRIGCTPGHQWPTQRGVIRADELRVGDVIQTCQLPEPERPRNPVALNAPGIGWFVGMYIAEGSQSNDTIQIACHADDTARFRQLQGLAEAFDGHAAMHLTGGNAATININSPALLGVLNTYVAGKTAKDKHLHGRCWKRDNAFLSNVLTGYLEGDGHFDAYNQRWRLGFTENDALAADLRTLCARLGYGLRLRRTFHKMFDQRFPGYRGEIRMERSSHYNAKQDGEVVAIGQSRGRQFWDIGVADEPHLFALASGVLTHNSKPNPMPESVQDRPTVAHEHIWMLSKQARYFYDAEAIRTPAKQSTVDRLSQDVEAQAGSYRANGGAKTNGTMKAVGRRDKQRGHARVHAGFNDRWDAMPRDEQVAMGANARTVWEIATAGYSEAHFATFPPEIPRRCILAGTSERGQCPACGAPWRRCVETRYENPGNRTTNGPRSIDNAATTTSFGVRLERRSETIGWEPTCSCDAGEPVPQIVLDPFLGSGTTAMVALRLGRHAVGIELNPAYCRLAERRIVGDAPLLNRVTVAHPHALPARECAE